MPTLAFCVGRHDEIVSFKPTPYWTLSAVVAPDNDNSSFSRQYLTLEWQGERQFNHQAIKSLYNSSLKDVKVGTVLSVKKSRKSTPKPKALNTVEMLKVASSRLGMGPHMAMQIAERLYTQGYISYPRTETNQYPKNFNLVECLQIQEHSSVWGSEVSELLRGGISSPKSGTDAGDHPPITPMRSAEFHEVGGGDNWRLYEYIARHFIASLAPDMVSEVTAIVVNIGGQRFSATCSAVVEPGFAKYLKGTTSSLLDEQSIPLQLREGDRVLVSEVKINAHMTQAPGYLTESGNYRILNLNN